MKRILFSLMTIVAVSAVAGVGSYALWSDSETANGNYIEAGTLNLLIDGGDWDGTSKIVVDNAYPGASGSTGGTVTNAGTIDGDITLSVAGVSDDENGLLEPEEEDGDTTDTTGELCGKLTVSINYNGIDQYTGPLSGINSLNLGTLTAGDSADYAVSYTIPTNTDNTTMTDRCKFDMNLILNQ